MAITWTDRIVSRFGARTQASAAPRSRTVCNSCGTINRRTLERGDDRCWSCDAELVRQGVKQPA